MILFRKGWKVEKCKSREVQGLRMGVQILEFFKYSIHQHEEKHEFA